jgi:hypothetical protein
MVSRLKSPIVFRIVSVLCLIILLFGGCKNEGIDPHQVSDDGVIVYFQPRDKTIRFPPKIYSDPDNTLPTLPVCDSLPVERHNIKVKMLSASSLESPQFQSCSFISEILEDRFFIGLGTKIVADVSYYKGVKTVIVQITSWGENLNQKSAKSGYVALRDVDGNIIASDSVLNNDGKAIFFKKNLERLKEVIIINTNTARLHLDYVSFYNREM